MRILWWSERFFPYVGGIETLGYNLIPILQQQGYTVEVVCSHSERILPDKEEYQSIPIHRLHFDTALHKGDLKQFLKARQKLLKIKSNLKPDIVHIHFSGPSPLFHWQTRINDSSQTLVTLHSLPTISKSGTNSLLLKTLKEACWVNGVSSHILESVSSFTLNRKSTTSVIYNGIDVPSIPIKSLPPTPTILCIGRMVAWKRFNWAIDVFSEIVQQFKSAKLIMIGDGVERQKLESQVASLGLKEQVTFTGILSQEEIYNQLNESSLVLLPSTAMENIPYVAVESALMARPLIASNVSGLPEIVVDGKTGYLLKMDDRPAWLSSIKHLLENYSFATQMGMRARLHVQHKFSLATCAQNYHLLYQQLALNGTTGLVN